jgi:hypothetical protein
VGARTASLAVRKSAAAPDPGGAVGLGGRRRDARAVALPRGGAALEAQPGLAGVSSAGTLLLFDLDGDGRQDLFVGRRGVPGRYPEPASSRVFRDTGGALRGDMTAGRALARQPRDGGRGARRGR